MIPAILLVIAAVAYRVASGLLIHSGTTWLSNFAPFAALALCSAAYFPAKLKFSLPLIALFLSDAILNSYYGASLFTPWSRAATLRSSRSAVSGCSCKIAPRSKRSCRLRCLARPFFTR